MIYAEYSVLNFIRQFQAIMYCMYVPEYDICVQYIIPVNLDFDEYVPWVQIDLAKSQSRFGLLEINLIRSQQCYHLLDDDYEAKSTNHFSGNLQINVIRCDSREYNNFRTMFGIFDYLDARTFEKLIHFNKLNNKVIINKEMLKERIKLDGQNIPRYDFAFNINFNSLEYMINLVHNDIYKTYQPTY